MATAKKVTWKKVLLILLVIFVIIQFIRPAKNQSSAETPGDIFAYYAASDSVKQMVRTICYNCHSNNTIYPWYDNIQPVAWWLAYHIKGAKEELNFSEFATYDAKKADKKFGEIIDEVKEKEMPLKSYTLTHRDARLTDPQREAIISWADGAKKQLNYK